MRAHIHNAAAPLARIAALHHAPAQHALLLVCDRPCAALARVPPPAAAAANTLSNTRSFWSSTGSDEAAADEAILYEIACPLGCPQFLRVAIYRAYYQQG